MRPENIIIKPIITKKRNDGLQARKYTLKVNKKSTKVDFLSSIRPKNNIIFTNQITQELN